MSQTSRRLILPPVVAELLGLEPLGVAQYTTTGGGSASGVRLGEVRVELVLEDRKSPTVNAIATMLPGETEVIISDRLASELGIVILDAYQGLWCLGDKIGVKTRLSAKPEYWR